MSAALSAPKLLKSSPQHHGEIMKLHVPTFYTMLPRFLQKMISRFWILSFLAPKWKSRYMILLGSYLYKFVDPQSANAGPKGTPIPLETIDAVQVVEGPVLDNNDIAEALLRTPPMYTTVVCVSTFRKRHYFAARSREEATLWVNSVQEARQEAIRRALGHAPKDSYPSEWCYFDRLGQSQLQSRERIRNRLAQREVELTSLTDGGALPKGYYG